MVCVLTYLLTVDCWYRGTRCCSALDKISPEKRGVSMDQAAKQQERETWVKVKDKPEGVVEADLFNVFP